MKALELAVKSIATSVTDAARRQRSIELLNGMAKDFQAAADVWSGYAKGSGAAPADPAYLLYWTGPQIAKKLFDIHLEARNKENELTAGRSTLEDPVVTLAYGLVQEGQTGPALAKSAVEMLNTAISRVKAFAETIRTTVPKKGAASSPVVKKASAPATKKKAAAKKPAAKKKAPTKKATPKKVAPKKTAAKKPAAKKAKPKKAAKKRR